VKTRRGPAPIRRVRKKKNRRGLSARIRRILEGEHSLRRTAKKTWEEGSGVVDCQSVISSRDSYIIGEFCPKVFALNAHPVSGLNNGMIEFGAEASAWTVSDVGEGALAVTKGRREPIGPIALAFPVFSIT